MYILLTVLLYINEYVIYSLYIWGIRGTETEKEGAAKG